MNILKNFKNIILSIILIIQIIVLSFFYNQVSLLIYLIVIEIIAMLIIRESNRSIHVIRPKCNIYKLTEEDKEDFNSCVICMTDEINNVVKIECDHMYHKDCIKNWLKNNNTCPICRVDLLNT